MIPLNILTSAGSNPIFRQALSKAVSGTVFTLIEHSDLSTDSNALLDQIERVANKTPESVILVVSPTKYELLTEIQELIFSLPLSHYPNFSNVVSQDLTPEVAAFTQITAGRFQDSLIVFIPEMLEILPKLVQTLKHTSEMFSLKSKSEQPTLVNIKPSQAGLEVSEDAQETLDAVVHIDVSSDRQQSGIPHQLNTNRAGWHGALKHFQIELMTENAPLPVEFESIPAAHSVFERAGARKIAVDRYGNQFAVFGFPDLNRPNSKVIIVRPGSPFPELIALHRFPTKVGLLPTHHSGFLLSSTLSVEQACMTLTGRTNKGDRIIAVESKAVYIQRNNDIVRWDGRRESDMGTIRQAIASLVLQWSQR